ncbi:MAG: hypothetical protein NDI94_01405 [Candidatus Woesearchaeota archaeon]|nr:hypothetical protein [Candidatus Woesearchaeota archaeon]
MLYGIDASKKVTPLMARDALIKCFTAAHKKVIDEFISHEDMDKSGLNRLKQMNVELQIKKRFEETGGDFDAPTKKDLQNVCDSLAAYSKNFRSEKIVKKHYDEMALILSKLD